MKQATAEFDATQARYRQIKDHIIKLINTGELEPDDRVPSENALVKTFGIARMTAHRALKELSDEGYVVRLSWLMRDPIRTFLRSAISPMRYEHVDTSIALELSSSKRLRRSPIWSISWRCGPVPNYFIR